MRNEYLARKAHYTPWMILAAVGSLLFATLWWQQSLQADDDSATSAVEAEIEDAEDGVEDKYRRLPPYYADIVTEAQKQEIYRIQAKYAEEIEQLKAELRKVIVQRDADIAALLTEDQKKQVEQIAADRRDELELLRKFREERAQQRTEEAGN